MPADRPIRNSVHRHSYYEIFIFKTGAGNHMIDLEQVGFKAPAIHIVAAGQVHKLDREAGSEGMVIMFTSEIRHPVMVDPRIRQLLRCGPSLGRSGLQHVRLNEILVLAGQIQAERNAAEDACNDVLENLLACLLLKCWRWSKAGNTEIPSDRNDLVSRFLENVDRQFHTRKQISSYAEDLAISPGHLNELVKKRLGRTASEILHERLLLEARRLLLHADLSVKEVSYALGIEDPAYFTRMFRKATGSTPGEYRDHIREKYQS